MDKEHKEMLKSISSDLDYKELHEKLGCYDCRKADPWALGKDACCLSVKGPLGGDDGRCVNLNPIVPKEEEK